MRRSLERKASWNKPKTFRSPLSNIQVQKVEAFKDIMLLQGAARRRLGNCTDSWDWRNKHLLPAAKDTTDFLKVRFRSLFRGVRRRLEASLKISVQYIYTLCARTYLIQINQSFHIDTRPWLHMTTSNPKPGMTSDQLLLLSSLRRCLPVGGSILFEEKEQRRPLGSSEYVTAEAGLQITELLCESSQPM